MATVESGRALAPVTVKRTSVPTEGVVVVPSVVATVAVTHAFPPRGWLVEGAAASDTFEKVTLFVALPWPGPVVTSAVMSSSPGLVAV